MRAFDDDDGGVGSADVVEGLGLCFEDGFEADVDAEDEARGFDNEGG